MTRKEDVERIRQIVAGAEMTRRREVEGGKATEEIIKADELRKENEARIKAEARLRATGIVDLFESIRDEGAVKYRDMPIYEQKKGFFGEKNVKVGDYGPAVVDVNGGVAKIIFNHKCENGFDREQEIVTAFLENGLLIVRGREKIVVEKNISLVQAVGNAICNPEKEHAFMRGGCDG